MWIVCQHCGSSNIRAVDNEPLHHPTKEEVATGTARVDNEVYIKILCDNCEKDSNIIGQIIFTKV